MAAHKAAFNCKRCPANNDPEKGRSCPLWWETVWENYSEGRTRIIKGCGYEQLPLYLTELVKASNRPAAAVESMRNETVVALTRGFTQVAETMKALPKR